MSKSDKKTERKQPNSAGNIVSKAAAKTKDAVATIKNSALEALDQNRDGQVDIFDIMILAMKTPGVHIRRDEFLRKELFKNHPQETIDKAIATTPAKAGISKEEVDKLANATIDFERICVSGISAALGAPGGWAMAATIPADIIQYYGYTLRAAQKLLYLYGFPEICIDNTEGLQLDSETLNQLILCLGIMNGVAGANNAIKGLAKALATGVEKKLLNTALTKGTFYPFVKKVMTWFGVKLTKSIFAGTVKKAIPVVGGVVGGGLTFFMFKPCCRRLKNVLSDTMLSNPDHISTEAENKVVESILSGEIIDAEFIDVEAECDDINEETITAPDIDTKQ